MLCSLAARADDPGLADSIGSPAALAVQLEELAQRTADQGDPQAARLLLDRARTLRDRVTRVAMRQDQEDQPSTLNDDLGDATFDEESTPPRAGVPTGLPEPRATIERTAELDRIAVQQLTDDVNQRIQRARQLIQARQPAAALSVLRLAKIVVENNPAVSPEVKRNLDRRLQNAIISAVRDEERIIAETAERIRIQSQAEEQLRALDELRTIQTTVSSLMTQFDAAMDQGDFNVRAFTKDTVDALAKNTKPFRTAFDLAVKARALSPRAEAPHAGVFKAQTEGFLATALAYRDLKFYRTLLTLGDIERAAIPFNDSEPIQYPDPDEFREMSERRIARYESTNLFETDEQSKLIREKLEEVIPMPFAEPTPFREVIEYIRNATRSPELPGGINFFVDQAGLEEAGFTMDDTVTLDLQGVKLKTSLELILKQLKLISTVRDGILRIDYEDSEDLPLTIRVYPVADLSLIPFNLIMGGGGMGMGGMGMGGMGMGGMGMGGMGMGGMGMGGMGLGGMGMGGMGGMGLGGMGGMFSLGLEGFLPTLPQPPTSPADGLTQKKMN